LFALDKKNTGSISILFLAAEHVIFKGGGLFFCTCEREKNQVYKLTVPAQRFFALDKKNIYLLICQLKEKRIYVERVSPAEETVALYLVTALVPSETACLASSPGRRRRTAVWISLEEIV